MREYDDNTLTIVYMQGAASRNEQIATMRKDLEYLIYHSLNPEIDDSIISISRGREMLGFKTMDEMREWRNNYEG